MGQDSTRSLQEYATLVEHIEWLNIVQVVGSYHSMAKIRSDHFHTSLLEWASEPSIMIT